jgi:hypothetical protein
MKWMDDKLFTNFEKTVGSAKVKAKKAAREVEQELKQTQKTAAKAADKIKESFIDIPKPQDWTTSAIGAATRGSASGFSAVQEARRANQDSERRHREMIVWQAKIERAILMSSIKVVPLSF